MAKVKFGLSNVHIFPIESTDEDGKPTYGTSFRLPGAVSITVEPAGNSTTFHGDNGVYFQTGSNSGYTGSLEVALVTDEWREKILGQTKDANGVMIEKSTDRSTEFAMTYQVENDVSNSKRIFYRCSATRPGDSNQTVTDTVTVQTEEFDFAAMPRINDGAVKATSPGTAEAEATWNTTVYEEVAVEGA